MKNTADSSLSGTNSRPLDSLFYATLYPDLLAAGLSSENELQRHYELHGRREGRSANIFNFLQDFGIPDDTLKPDVTWLQVLRVSNPDITIGIDCMTLSAVLSPLKKGLSKQERSKLRRVDTVTLLAGYLYKEGKETSALNLFESGLHTLKALKAQDYGRILALCLAIGYEDSLYRHRNNDLSAAGIETLEGRLAHFIKYGVRENRCYHLPSWLKHNGLPTDLLSNTDGLQAAIERTSKLGNPIGSASEALETLTGGGETGRVWFSENAVLNAEIYTRCGKVLSNKYPDEGGQLRALRLFQIACTFDAGNQEALFQIGQCHARREEHEVAAEFFSRALECGGDIPKIIPHLVRMYRASGHLDAAYSALVTYIPQLRDNRDLMNQISEFCEELWAEAEKSSAVDIVNNRRDALIESTVRAAERQHHLWVLAAGVSDTLPNLATVRSDRVLIVGDRFLPQCDRYRINQKVEQLEGVGCNVTVISWTDVQDQMSELAFHDIVIFYRVPALPPVVQAIAQVNASGGLAIYEIDDLIFDPIYPPSLDTYGGSVGISQYTNLVRGMALFNAAARLCRIGIASTKPLQEQLAKLVSDKRCLLHRNGIDGHLGVSQTAVWPKSVEEINIFYGSGTLAHNNDFCDLIVPVIDDIMTKDNRVQLVVAGYLKLPVSFSDKFHDRVVRLPPTKDISVYYNYLRIADINLATLIPDEITDCKSELKWFEAAFFNIPSVVSNTRNYLDVINANEDALIASTPEEWHSCLTALIADSDLRHKIGQAARDRVLLEYSVESLGQQLKKNLEREVQILRPQTCSKPKVAMVNVFFAPQSIGGATRVFEDNISAYREEHGHEFDFVVFTSGMIEGPHHNVEVHNDANMRVYRANTIYRQNMDWIPKDQNMGEVFRRFLEFEQPDLVHFHCVQRLTGSIVEVTRDIGIPYILTMHDAWWFSDLQFLVDPEGMVYPKGHPGKKQLTEIHPPSNATADQSMERRLYLSSLVKSASKVVTVSESFAEICRLNGFPETEVCENGVTASIPWRKKNTSQTERVVCGQIGSMSAHKGYNLLRDTVMTLQPRNLEFLIVDHSQGPDWSKRTAWGGVPVTYIGRQQQKDVAALYGRIDVLMAPSIWPESFGLVTREAAACGCWVVASNIGAIGEHVEQGVNGFLISPDKTSLGKVIQALDDDPKRYKGPAATTPIRTGTEQANEMIASYREILLTCPPRLPHS